MKEKLMSQSQGLKELKNRKFALVYGYNNKGIHDKIRLGMIDFRLLGLALEYKNESLVIENNYCPVIDSGKYGKSPVEGTFKTYRQFNLLTKGECNEND